MGIFSEEYRKYSPAVAEPLIFNLLTGEERVDSSFENASSLCRTS